ncbi:MAG TPA: site-specific integrase [Pyrinomonadaceae bacterium]|nr:site-specific integrase [Pyrinomonadaceae bacterium]
MSRDRRGSVVQKRGKLYARVQFTDEGGRRRDLWRKAENRTQARELCRQLLSEIESQGTSAFDNSKVTFADLCDYYRGNYLTEARYVNGIKVSGLRSLKTSKYQLNALRAFFGRVRLRNLTYEHIRSYKAARLATEKRGGGTLCMALVNRELAMLRKMLNVARAARWIQHNPFHDGNSLISAAAERQRTVVLSREGEERLLAACTGKRKHLRAFIIRAVDSGCRKGELLSARWKEINFERREWFIPMMNTKTARARTVPVSSRMVTELRQLWAESDGELEALVFGVSDVKRAFDSARREAGLPSLRIHDLRHSFASRLAQNHLPLAELARTLGHTT